MWTLSFPDQISLGGPVIASLQQPGSINITMLDQDPMDYIIARLRN